jgi:tripartite-type tricarboxylate transporter receptor subunit TctC
MKRRLFSRTILSILTAGPWLVAWADAASDFPAKPIKIIVPFSAGGTADILPRLIGQKLGDKWGQPIIVENRPGAGGNIGADAVAKAPADGYTLLATPPAPLTINQYLYKGLTFSPEKFVPVTVLAAVPNVLAVRTTLPFATTAELITYARQNPGKLNVATQGNGTTSHLTAAMFAAQAGVRVTYIPYRGTAPALTDLMAGQVDVFFDNISSMYPQHAAGKTRILAVTGTKRSSLLPQVPTVAEAALPGFDASTWFGIVAPPGTPQAIADKLQAAVAEVLALPEMQQQFRERGADIVAGTPGQMRDFMASERKRWKSVIESANVKLD